MSRLTNDLFEITELAHHGPETCSLPPSPIVALVIMFTIQWQLALVVTIMIPVFLVVIVTMRGAMPRASHKVKQKTGAINANLNRVCPASGPPRPLPARARS